MTKKLLLLILLSFLASCYNPKTHGNFLSAEKDAWIDGYAVRISEHETADKGLVFCRANIQEDGSAKPKCYLADFNR